MVSKPMVPVEQYLRMQFEGPDPEYLDGELLERNLGEYPHSETQANLFGIFFELKRQGTIQVTVEIHLRITPTRYRVADLAIFLEKPTERIPSAPPYITIEIISPGDRMYDIKEKCRDYAAWGVRHIWLVDPSDSTFSVWDNGIRGIVKLELPQFDLENTPEQVFG